MLSFHVKFVQTDRQTDKGKTICPPVFQYGGIKIFFSETVGQILKYFHRNVPWVTLFSKFVGEILICQ